MFHDTSDLNHKPPTMSLKTVRAAALAVTALLTAACGPDSTIVEPAATSLDAPALASAPYEVNETAVTLAIGDTRQLEATRLPNGKDAPAGSITWSSDDPAIATVSATGLVTGVAPGQTVVAATRGAHRVEVAITVTGCTVSPLAIGTTSAELTSDDCEFPAGRLADFFSMNTTPGETIELTVSGPPGWLGVREASADPTAGASHGIGSAAYMVRVVGNGGPLNTFFSGLAGEQGAYTITRAASTEAHRCGAYNFLIPGASFAAAVTMANACHFNVAFSPVPEAIGKPLAAHWFSMYLTEIKPYTITINGLTDSFDPALTIFHGGAVVAQDVPGPLPSSGSRTVTFTPAAAGYYNVEVSGGRFIDNLVTWEVQTGPYHMTVSQ